MLALVGALVAGALATLAPCVLPLLPVIVGGSVAGVAGSSDRTGATRRALVIAGSLGASVFVFTLLLRASTALLGIPPDVWSVVAGGLLVVLGLLAVFPQTWERASVAMRLQARSTRGLSRARDRPGLLGEVLTGAALGPVFTSCSPLYGYVLVTVLPAAPGRGLLLLLLYVVGLSATLFAIAVAGSRLVRHVRFLTDPDGWVRRGLGVVFVLVGLVVMTGADRDLQTWVIEHSPVAPWELDQGFIPE